MELGKMFPSPSALNEPDRTSVNAVNTRQISMETPRGSNGNNLFFGQSGHPVSRSLQVIVPALGNHVGYVLSLSPKPKVGRIHACSVVAGMAHAHTRRNLAKGKNPGNTMGFTHLAPCTKVPISGRTLAGGPIPTPTIMTMINISVETHMDGIFGGDEIIRFSHNDLLTVRTGERRRRGLQPLSRLDFNMLGQRMGSCQSPNF